MLNYGMYALLRDLLANRTCAKNRGPSSFPRASGPFLAFVAAGAGFLYFCLINNLGAGTGDRAPEVVVRAVPGAVDWFGSLSPKTQKKVNEAIDRGLGYLRRTQVDEGWFKPLSGSTAGGKVGNAALPGLALLECAVSTDDPVIQKAARLVRQEAPKLTQTYGISLSLLFLVRLRDPGDDKLIRSLALRLAGSQNDFGGWTYKCRLLEAADEQKLLDELHREKLEKNPKPLTSFQAPGPEQLKNLRSHNSGDNSNTQFAILALWVARRHDLPLEPIFRRIEERFRFGQLPGGWGYHVIGPPYGSMTCVGLLGLAVGRASAAKEEAGKRLPAREAWDEGIGRGLWALGTYLTHPGDRQRGTLNLYFLWSVERVGVLYNLKTIGGKNWYPWGVNYLLPAQKVDGSWNGKGYLGSSPTLDTSLALLFLKRSDLLPDLRETLQKRLTITDPGPDLKAIRPKKSPGDKTDSPGNKNAVDDAPLSINLGNVKAKQTTECQMRVRGPAAFKITAVRGSDGQLKVADPSQTSREVHELTLTLRPDKAGDFQRTIFLFTDLPGRAEVPVEIRVRVLP